MNSKCRSASLMVLAICLFVTTTPSQVRRRSPHAATPQRSNDWAYPQKGMKSELVAGRRMYFLGDGFAAELPRRSANGGQHATVIISAKTVAEFVASVERDGGSADQIQQVLAWGVFGKVCKGYAEGRKISDAYIGPTAVEMGGHTGTEHHFRTVSGNTARIYVSTDRSLCLVMIDPPGRGDDMASARQAREPTSGRAASGGHTFDDLRLLYMRKDKDTVLKALGTPANTYDAGERVAWTYRNLAYDPILGRYKNATIWFDKYGFVALISELR